MMTVSTPYDDMTPSDRPQLPGYQKREISTGDARCKGLACHKLGGSAPSACVPSVEVSVCVNHLPVGEGTKYGAHGETCRPSLKCNVESSNAASTAVDRQHNLRVPQVYVTLLLLLFSNFTMCNDLPLGHQLRIAMA